MQDKMIGMIKRQDDKGIELLQQQYSGMMHYIVGHILQDTNDIEECISDICMKVWHSIESYSPEKGQFSTWLTTISRNTALNYQKRGSKEHEELKEETARTPSLEEDVLRREQAEALNRAILILSTEERHIFYRKYYYLQQTAQIAAELGVSQRSIEGKLYRLRKKLQTELGGDCR